jgi:serine/threonine-protein kinase
MAGPQLGSGESVPTELEEVDSGPSPTVLDRPGRRSAPPPIHEDPTEIKPPSISMSSSSSSLGSEPNPSLHGPTHGTTVGSPLEALAHAEILGTRRFCHVGMMIAIGGAIGAYVLPGHVIATRIFLGGIGIAFVSLIYLLHRTRNPATYHDGIGTALAWYIPACAVCGAIPYFGPFSPVAVLLVFGTYFTGTGASFRLALAIYITCALAQAVTGGLVTAGVISDPGFIYADYLTVKVQIICQCLVQMVLAGAFVVARASRRSQLIALGELERAVRAVAQREALLEEAREELRRAVGSGRGRFTDQIIGNYKLGDLIGRGAMGEVYEAVDPRVNQAVAVKMLAQTSLGNAHHVERFLRELRTAATIDSPNVVRVLEVGEQPLPHLVMERLRGRDLAAILRTKRAMPHDRVVDLIQQVGAGITAAGAAGVIHRDLKPQNLFLCGATWKILDFGVSRLTDTSDTLTAGHVVGTPAYMAPEQASGAAVDHRTDLYALAAIAYRVLTGQPPFSGGEVAETLYRVVHTAPRRPSMLADLPSDVDLVLAIGLAKRPGDRFATAEELANALAAGLAGTLDETLRSKGQGLVIDGAWKIAP